MKLSEKYSNIILKPTKKIRITEKDDKSFTEEMPWFKTRRTREKFSSDKLFCSLESIEWLEFELVAFTMLSIVLEFNGEETFGYLTTDAVDKLKYNNFDFLIAKMYVKSHVNKNIIFVNLH